VFISCGGSDFVEMLVGRGAARVRELFDRARKEGRTKSDDKSSKSIQQGVLKKLAFVTPDTPDKEKSTRRIKSAIIFIDEIDALAKTRSISLNSNDEREQTLNCLLTEMDGFESRDSNVENSEDYVHILVVAATNRPEILDPALLRPGRFDRIVKVLPPNATGRLAILELHAKGIRHSLVLGDWERVSKDGATAGFSGAELENVVNEAALLAVRRGKKVVAYSDVMEAVNRAKSSRDFGW
jgi:cell division protease FtsH